MMQHGEYKECLVHSFVPFLMVVESSSSDSVCKGRWEIVTSFLEAGWDSWTCISLGTATFFLEYTLPVIQFSTTSVGDDSSSGTGSIGDDSGSKTDSETGSSTRLVTLGRINEIGILILVFLVGIITLKIRSKKIRLTFIECNIH